MKSLPSQDIDATILHPNNLLIKDVYYGGNRKAFELLIRNDFLTSFG
jgi:hypothetical protein